MIDERTRAALSRLTENERACLMRRLHHQTAKEMAIDLGISPHAVEKRLKMARTKLGVSSSLEAARLLERYGQTGPQPADLVGQDGDRQEGGDPLMPAPAWRRIAPYLLTGVIAMSIAVIALLAVAQMNAPEGGVAPLPQGGAVLNQAASSYQVQLLLRQGDKPLGSSKLLIADGQRARTTATNSNGTRYDLTLTVEAREGATYFVKMDLDSRSAAGRSVHVTPAVLVKAGEPSALAIDLPEEPLNLTLVITPASGSIAKSDQPELHPVIGSTIKTYEEYEAQREKETGHKYERPQLIKAPPATVRAFVDETFDTADRDRSGYLERAEAPATFAQSTVLRKGPLPRPGETAPYPDSNEQVTIMTGPPAQAAYLATMDKDADGRVSREEYQAASFPRFMAWGVPANWRGAPKVAAK